MVPLEQKVYAQRLCTQPGRLDKTMNAVARNRIQRTALTIKDGLLGLIYPRSCYGCDSHLGQYSQWLCDDCLDGLHPIEEPMCEVCGQPYPGDLIGGFHCANCADLSLQFDFARAAYQSRDLARVLVHRFKYKDHYYLASLLGEMLDKVFEDPRIGKEADIDEWLLVPVPLHSRRLREREYNQAEEICRQLTRRRGLKMAKVLRRTRYTRRQAMLERGERLKNLQGAFIISSKTRHRDMIEGRKILLVDDVLTTGATASECARVLSEAGALKVVVITVVRG